MQTGMALTLRSGLCASVVLPGVAIRTIGWPTAHERRLGYHPGMEPAHPHSTVSPVLAPRFRTFLEQRLFAALATIDPDGAPRQAVIWYRLEDDGRILINSRIGRRWP